ncbi:MAG: protein kinase [Roseiflexaceae bacterium]|nr:protein kinase [Roseiflexaceae bacterium]
MSELIGRTLGSYQIIEQLGQGGMATVYKAYHPAMDRYVAIKVLPRHMAQDANFRARFERESRTIAKLEHRYILPVHDSGEDDGVSYMVMRYTDGGTLSDLIASGKLTYERVAVLVAQVAEALGYAHRQGIIHRDIKPANVLISRDGDAQLSDFGIARIVEGSMQLTTDGMMIGTPFYMAPEQVQGQPSDARTDIYALGVVLYEALTGKRPYEAETPLAVALMHLHNPLPPPRQIQPNLPEMLERIILRAMAKNPADRFQSADDMAEALRAMVTPISQRIATAPVDHATITLPVIDTTIEAAQPGVNRVSTPVVPIPVPPRRSRPAWLFPAIIAVVLIVAIGGFSILGMRARRERLAVDPGTVPTELATSATSIPIADPAAPAADSPQSAAADLPVVDMVSVGDHILITTINGLVRWQGNDSQLFTTAHGMPFDDTRKILVNSDGTFWIAGYEDLAHITPSESGIQVIKRYTPADLKLDNVSALWLESDGTMLAGGYLPSGLAHYDGTQWEKLQPPIPQESLGELSGDIYSIMRSSDGTLWVGTEIGLFQLKDGVWDRYDKKRGVGVTPIQRIVESDGVLLAAAADNGLLRYNPDRDLWVRVSIEANSPITTIAVLSGGTLWVGSQDFVARSSDGGRTWAKVGTTDAKQIHSAPSSIVEDSDGRIWVGADEGLSYYTGTEWITP